MRVLVIAPHMDDEVLGMGGTIAKHVAKGDKVFVCFIAHRKYGHQYDTKLNQVEMGNAKSAKKVLGYNNIEYLNLEDEQLDGAIQRIIIALEKYAEKVKPKIVYVCHGGDNNQDHRAVFDAARVVFRPMQNMGIKKILSYEVPSSTEQSPPIIEFAFLPNYYVNIEKYLKTKIRAFKCYEKEKRSFPHPRSVEGVEVLAKKRGTEIGFKAAEAFMLLRGKWE